MNPITFQSGDIFVVDGGHIFDNIIVLFESIWSALRGRDGSAKWSHSGVIAAPPSEIFETTPWRTGQRVIAQIYAGSDIGIWRWANMTPERFMAGMKAVSGQNGRIYPYWRLLVHALGLGRFIKGKSMECSVIAASFLKGAGYPLLDDPWAYDPDKLIDELVVSGKGHWVFKGSMREAGLI